MNRRILMAMALGISAVLAHAQGSPIDGESNPDTGASAAAQQQQINFTRDVLSKMGVDQNLGRQVPGNVPFTDEHGRAIKFGDLFGSRPIIVMPMFFECKGVCSVETDSLLHTAIDMPDLSVGRDFDIVMLSINPKETPELTLPRWNGTVKIYNVHGDRPEAEKGFHFLTGSYDNIRKITDALGFRWVYNAKDDQINHPAGLMVLSPTGQITGYYVDKEFQRTFLTHLLADAKDLKVSPKTESQLFGCIMIDHATGRRSIVIENVIRLFAGVFAVGLACWIVGMSLSGKHRNLRGGSA
ncbi:MAG: SCO family protein [Fimbriimonadales bacterium]